MEVFAKANGRVRYTCFCGDFSDSQYYQSLYPRRDVRVNPEQGQLERWIESAIPPTFIVTNDSRITRLAKAQQIPVFATDKYSCEDWRLMTEIYLDSLKTPQNSLKN